jgi:hypothetical protein
MTVMKMRENRTAVKTGASTRSCTRMKMWVALQGGGGVIAGRDRQGTQPSPLEMAPETGRMQRAGVGLCKRTSGSPATKGSCCANRAVCTQEVLLRAHHATHKGQPLRHPGCLRVLHRIPPPQSTPPPPQPTAPLPPCTYQ